MQVGAIGCKSRHLFVAVNPSKGPLHPIRVVTCPCLHTSVIDEALRMHSCLGGTDENWGDWVPVQFSAPQISICFLLASRPFEAGTLSNL